MQNRKTTIIICAVLCCLAMLSASLGVFAGTLGAPDVLPTTSGISASTGAATAPAVSEPIASMPSVSTAPHSTPETTEKTTVSNGLHDAEDMLDDSAKENGFSFTGLIVAIVIGAAVVLLVLLAIPKKPRGNR